MGQLGEKGLFNGSTSFSSCLAVLTDNSALTLWMVTKASSVFSKLSSFARATALALDMQTHADCMCREHKTKEAFIFCLCLFPNVFGRSKV